MDMGGVLIRPFNCWPYLHPPKVARVQCTEAVRASAIEWARGELGKPFDNAALWAFLRDRAGLPSLQREWRDPNKWYCSEFAMRTVEKAGLFPYSLITPKDTVSPNILLVHLNPFLTEDNIREFHQ